MHLYRLPVDKRVCVFTHTCTQTHWGNLASSINLISIFRLWSGNQGNDEWEMDLDWEKSCADTGEQTKPRAKRETQKLLCYVLTTRSPKKWIKPNECWRGSCLHAALGPMKIKFLSRVSPCS